MKLLRRRPTALPPQAPLPLRAPEAPLDPQAPPAGFAATALAALAPPALSATLILGLALGLAACGSDSKTPDGNTGGTPPPPPPPPVVQPRGELITRADVARLTRAEIDTAAVAAGVADLAGAARCDARIQRLEYYTIGARQENNVKATAALMTPQGTDCAGPHPLIVYTHDTTVLKARTLADPADRETRWLIPFLVAQGYAVIAPDYLGFGGSDYSFHPYLHADSEASATVDALKAALTTLQADSITVQPGLLVAGYSQGGHASMATQRLIETAFATEFTITAAGHMSGPYDLVGSIGTALALLPGGTGGSSIFLPFAMTSYQKVYGDLYTTPTQYFKEPYAGWVDTLLPGDLDTTALITNGRLPLQLGDLITDQWASDLAQPSSALNQHLVANSLLDWTPRAPMLLCGGQRDPVVVMSNAVTARDALVARGATVTIVDVEQVPAFAGRFPETLSPSEQAIYHSQIVPPLCLSIVRDQVFAPASGGGAAPGGSL